jgi:hypothetical protein
MHPRARLRGQYGRPANLIEYLGGTGTRPSYRHPLAANERVCACRDKAVIKRPEGRAILRTLFGMSEMPGRHARSWRVLAASRRATLAAAGCGPPMADPTI